MSTPLIAIVGRPNVGKSTLFNRLTGQRKAIEEKEPGVTRDRLYGRATWRDRDFLLVDTGGLFLSSGEGLEREVRKQVFLAIEEASVIIFLVDGRQGITPLDEEIADLLRRQGKPVILAVNKIESRNKSIDDFYQLGFGEPLSISAAHGLNIGDLLDRVFSFLPPGVKREKKDEAISVAVVGRPNVGKSSLINLILGEERVIVNEEPGTTRDSVDTWLEREGTSYIFVDTAGIRRKSRVKENLEYYSVLRSLRTIENSDIAVLLLDAAEGVTEQDQKIAGYVLECGKAMIVALNKWDLVKEDRKKDGGKEILTKTRESLKFASFVPVIFTSIYEPRRLKNLFELINKVYRSYSMRIPTPVLNRLLEDAQGVNPVPSLKGKRGRIYYWTQVRSKPPSFVLFVNDPSLIHFSYLRYLENRLREAFDLEGTPVKLLLRARNRKGER